VYVSPGKALAPFCLCLLLAAGTGCSRAVYRQRADREVYSAIHSKEERLLAEIPMRAEGIAPFEDSRFFDAFDPDNAPMPPDDPQSHSLMEKVGGHAGARKWMQSGEPAVVQSDAWRAVLTRGRDGMLVLNLKDALRLGIHNSRDFQREREDLYLSALDLTFDRFQFSPRMALGQKTSAETVGKNAASKQNEREASVLTDGSVRWLNSTGGELLASFANSFVWDVKNGSLSETASTFLNFGLVQPLLRLGSKERILENLTQGERALLANVRQMQQYQQGYYLRVAAGRGPGEGPSRGGAVGALGLGLAAGSPSGTTVAPRAEGFMGLLEEAQRIENLESNVARLRESMEQLSAAFDAGRISSRLQVDQARLALFNGQSSLLSSKAAYQTRLDTFKIELGLPPDLPVTVRDSFLARFGTSNPEATALDRRIALIQGMLRAEGRMASLSSLAGLAGQLEALLPALGKIMESADKDLATLKATLPLRQSQLEALLSRKVTTDLGVELSVLEPSALLNRLSLYGKRTAQNVAALVELEKELEKLQQQLSSLTVEEARAELRDLAGVFSGLLLSLSLNQTAVRLESATLPKVAVSEEEALAVARENRLDWMNARARLVDAWRKMDYFANALKSGLTFNAEGGLGTIRNNAARFDSRTGVARVGLRFDTPLNRLAERNAYRESQIDYQRARRDYMLFEDKISQSLRNTLRIVDLSQLNFELRRAAVHVAISQVDLARLRLEEPPRPGVVAQIGATTARDLVTALSDLLAAQNDFLSMRTGYEVLRLVLDFEAGTLQTDSDGMWLDPGPITGERLKNRAPRWNPVPQFPSPLTALISPAPVKDRTVHTLAFRQEQVPTVR
jgi:Outer membrane efflux protein